MNFNQFSFTIFGNNDPFSKIYLGLLFYLYYLLMDPRVTTFLVMGVDQKSKRIQPE